MRGSEADGSAPDVVWHSAPPGFRSSYGQQSELVLDRLSARYKVALSTSAAPNPRWNALQSYHSPNLDGRELALNTRRAFAGTNRPQRAIAFTNVVQLANDPCDEVDLAIWLPVNFAPPSPQVLEYLRRRSRSRVLAMTEWAATALSELGVASAHVPCAVDLDVFHPDGADRERTRSVIGVPDDAFVIGVVAVNNEWFSNRKSLPEILMAFAEFSRRRSDAMLFLHTDAEGTLHEGIDLLAVLRSLGVPLGRVLITPPGRYRAGLTREELASLYRTFDVLAAPSAGEGFGIPVIEAQATGVPVIASSWATQRELVGAGWTVGGQPRWAPWARSWQFTPAVPDIVEALEAAYDSPESIRSDAVAFARRYSIDEVFSSRWVPFLREWLGPPDNRAVSRGRSA